MPASIHDLLELAVKHRASDVILKASSPPAFRIDGRVKISNGAALNPTLIYDFCQEVIFAAGRDLLLNQGSADALQVEEQSKQLLAQLEHGEELDLDFTVPELMRVRANLFKQRHSYGASLRIIPLRPFTFEELNLPTNLRDFARLPQGLVLITGPTGSGKSTTLAAVLQYINETRESNIITIEDPIEYIFADKKSVVHQREVGQDTKSFAAGLRSVLRQTPDVIMIGEMRDADTISVALNAAEMGHLVISSLHTTSAPAAIDRILHAFPPHDQPFIRLQLAGVLGGVVAQKLIPRANGVGRLPAVEIMSNSPTVRKYI
ncbi:MAG TPA: PilT/PilU family type 4a pilus ATPase, partial [Armatimonadota bacterium]